MFTIQSMYWEGTIKTIGQASSEAAATLMVHGYRKKFGPMWLVWFEQE